MSPVRILAYLCGLVFLFLGIIGFMPAFTPNNLLLGYFVVNDLHNILHVLTGVAALVLAMDSVYSRWFFRVFGLVYLILAVVGFFRPEIMVMMPVNSANSIMQASVGVIFLLIGLIVR